MKQTVLFLLITGFSLACWGQQKAQQSFDELVTAHDPDVTDDLKHDVSYVCFEPKEEKFFIVFYNLPDPASWQDAYSWETVATTFRQDAKQFGIHEYTNGMDDDQLYLALAHPKAVWEAKGHRNAQKKVVIDPSSLQILDDGGDGYSFEVGPASVSLSARYNNTQKDAVRRFVEVRQSTKRFRQFWEVNDSRIEDMTGRCELWSRGRQRSGAK